MTTHAGFHLIFNIFFEKPSAVEFFKNVHVVLETRDYEDSATIFGFPVSNHKKNIANF